MSNSPGWWIRVAPLLLASVALAAPQDSGPADVQFSKQANLSSAETVAQAREYEMRMQGVLRYVTSLEQEALRKKDVIRINCLRDKKEKIRANLAVAEKSVATLDDAAAKGDDGARQHEFTRMTILNQQVDLLKTEASNCVGAGDVVPGQVGVTVEIDPSITPTDPTTAFTPPLEPVARPPEATPQT